MLSFPIPGAKVPEWLFEADSYPFIAEELPDPDVSEKVDRVSKARLLIAEEACRNRRYFLCATFAAKVLEASPDCGAAKTLLEQAGKTSTPLLPPIDENSNHLSFVKTTTDYFRQGDFSMVMASCELLLACHLSQDIRKRVVKLNESAKHSVKCLEQYEKFTSEGIYSEARKHYELFKAIFYQF